ncbi:MAG: Kelch repeat-containing protein [Candidatus Kariarchaeaceae archaeon]
MKRLIRFNFLLLVCCILLISTSIDRSLVKASEYTVEWTTINTDGPEVREVQFVFDTQSKKALLFSGWDLDNNDLRTTWVYNFVDNSWKNMTATMVDPDVHPGARIGYNGAYDPINDQIIIFGGFNVCTGGSPSSCVSWGDTWSYDMDANTWTDLKPDNSPPPHTYGQLVYDTESQKMLLFGGYGDGLVSMGETWVYDPAANNWTNMNPVVSPPKRHAPIAIYDSHADRIIMFGGVDPRRGGREDHFNDIWSYDFNTNTWVELFPNGSPSKRTPQTFIYIPSIDKSLLTGGWINYELDIDHGQPYNDSWLYDYTSNTWTEITNNFNTCYLYDFNEFKIRNGTLEEIVKTTITKTITETTTTVSISKEGDSDFYLLSPILLIPIFGVRYLKSRNSQFR